MSLLLSLTSLVGTSLLHYTELPLKDHITKPYPPRYFRAGKLRLFCYNGSQKVMKGNPMAKYNKKKKSSMQKFIQVFVYLMLFLSLAGIFITLFSVING
jgi:hypothetical protein